MAEATDERRSAGTRYTRVLGGLRKLGIHKISLQTVERGAVQLRDDGIGDVDNDGHQVVSESRHSLKNLAGRFARHRVVSYPTHRGMPDMASPPLRRACSNV